MFPYFGFGEWTFHTNSSLIFALLILSFIALQAILGHKVSFYKNILFVGILGLISLFGARLFHILIEKPELLNDPKTMFSRADGMVFYGSFIFASLSFPFLLKSFYSKNLKKQIWDISTILLAFAYGVLRFGCFASGCCWGKICHLPWSVTYYNSQSAMPYLGVPVHPVQLYDSLGGFLIALFLVWLYKNKQFQGRLYALFCIAYPLLRFFTEIFRGDSFRGENIILGLSTSQTISVAVFAFGLSLLFKKNNKEALAV